jgi:hypothetical protein
MTVPLPHTVTGFENRETFRIQLEFGMFIRRMLPLLCVLFVVGALLFAFVLAFARLGVLSWVVAVPVSAALCAVLFHLKRRQYESTLAKGTLELSPAGVVLAEPHLRIEMPWPHVHQIGPAALMTPLMVNVGNEALAQVAYAIGAASVQRPEEGLIGAASLSVRKDAPAMFRQQVQQNDEGRDVAPATGQPLRAIVLSYFDPDWRNGRIGAWIRAYRPDLLEQNPG